MAWSDIPVYAPTNLIPSAWANQLYQNEVHLDNRSGHDAPAPNLFLVSGAAPSLVNGWRALQAGDFAPGVIPDAAMANLKVTKAGDVMTGDLAVSRQGSGQPTVGYLFLGQTGGLVYVGYDGTNIVLQGARVFVPGILQAGGDLQAPGAVFGADGVQVNGGGGYKGGSTAVGVPSMFGLHLGLAGIDSSGPAAFLGNVTVGGYVAAASASINTAVAATVGLVVRHADPAGAAIGVLNAAGSAFDFTVDHSTAAFNVAVRGVGAVFTGLVQAAGAVLNANSASVSALQIQQANLSGVSIGVLNTAGSAYDLLLTHAGASLGVPLQTAGTITSVAGGAPITSASAVVCSGLNADMTDGFHASATAGPSRIPVADAAGKLDAWITPAVAGATVPSGAIVAFDTAAHLTAAGSGWTPHTAADGRLLVGTGTTFGQAFAQGSTYGASWGHAHSTPAHQHSGSPMSVSGTTGPASGSGNQANVATPNPANATQSHTHDLGTLGVAGNTANDGASTAGSTTWLPAMLGVVWGRKL